MAGFVLYITTAFALIFVIEGLVYLLFPAFVHKMMETAIMIPANRLRLFGLVMAVTGFSFIGMIKLFS